MYSTTETARAVENGQPTIGRETTIGQFRIKVPSVSVHTVGAGGGSIAHVPPLTKALRVGPQSAGAEPGPAAYGRGGEAPTVTDAHVVAGTLRGDALLGETIRIAREPAAAALGPVAAALGLPVTETAAELDRRPTAVRLSHRHDAADAARLDDGHRIIGQLLMAEIRGCLTGVTVPTPIQRDHPVASDQARHQRAVVAPGHPPPRQAKDGRIGTGSLVVVPDPYTIGIRVAHRGLPREPCQLLDAPPRRSRLSSRTSADLRAE